MEYRLLMSSKYDVNVKNEFDFTFKYLFYIKFKLKTWTSPKKET